jgi:MOSC domain-containing protein
MEVVALWRYPVKSMQGEALPAADITELGITGDRAFGITDVATDLVLTARREPRLLYAKAAYRDDGGVDITLPDGSAARDDGDLSEWLGRPVRLDAASPDRSGHYEIAVDFEREDTSEWVQWTGPRGTFHDSTRTRVSLLSTATIGAWDARRFRANVLLSDGDDDALIGATVRVGSAALDVVKPIDRCVIVTRPQPGGIDRDLDVLRTIHRERDGNLAIAALVHTEGRVAVGDELDVVARDSV